MELELQETHKRQQWIPVDAPFARVQSGKQVVAVTVTQQTWQQKQRQKW